MTTLGNTGEYSSNPVAESVRIQEAASQAGFDWPDAWGVLAKIREEADEIRQALEENDVSQARRELGDLLLAAMNLSRFLKTDPGAELAAANARFSRRYAALCRTLEQRGVRMAACTLDELDAVWNEVKNALQADAQKGS